MTAKAFQQKTDPTRIPGRGERTEPQQLDVYESLSLLNQHCRAAVEMLSFLAAHGSIPAQESTYFQLMVEEARSTSSQSVMEALDAQEVEVAASVSEKRLALEKTLFGT